MLYCPNYNCQTPNPENHKYCQKCRTLLPKHYLWAIGDGADSVRVGELLADRYLCIASQIFLDTKPGLFPTQLNEVPERYSAYLRLTPYQLHIPQIYDLLVTNTASTLVLLDQAAVYSPSQLSQRGLSHSELLQSHQPGEVQLLPRLTSAWQKVNPLRQLNWLWQIAHLWQPLSSEQVVSSLLNPDLLRVEGPVVRLLELQADTAETKATPSLANLGQFWSSLAESACSEIAAFLQQICQQLKQGKIYNSELLIHRLDEGLAVVGKAQSCQIQIATRTDRGPSRQRNEDACYPPDGALQSRTLHANQPASPPSALVIVCDGIGGHQGGDVASNLAIETVGQRIQPLNPEELDPITLTMELEKAICDANDQISQRNDSEQRFDRQRMGTTLVMGVVRSHELYIAHVGDSRAYWITRWGCRQVTLDDDVASREVRLGYSSYRQALQQPSAGSLVQALGMGPSKTLHPTVQRFLLDEDGIFLLCSDGLSDNDRVDEIWETDILPLLNHDADLAKVSQRLIEVGNTQNGYDNVTVGLIYYQVSTPQSMPHLNPAVAQAPPSQPKPAADTVLQVPETQIGSSPTTLSSASDSTLKTQVLPAPAPRPNKIIPLLLGILLLIGLGGLLLYFLSPSLRRQIDPLIGLSPESDSSPTSIAPPSPLSSEPLRSLEAGMFVRLSRSAAQSPGSDENAVTLLANPAIDPSSNAANSAPGTTSAPGGVPEPATSEPAASAPSEPTSAPTIEGIVSVGSILQVVGQQGTATDRWIRLRVCSVPGSMPADSPGSPSPSPTQPPSNPPASDASASETSVSSTDGSTTAGTPPVVASDNSPPADTIPNPSPTETTLLQAGEQGWIEESTLLPLVTRSADLTTEQQGACTTSNIPPSPTSGVPASPPSP